MKRALEMTEKIMEVLAALCLAFFCITTFAQVFSRFVLKSPLSWSEELARFSFIYMVFLGWAVGVRRGAHYNFDIFGKSKNATVAFVAKFATCIFEIGFLTFLLCTAVTFLPQMHAKASSVLRIPTSIPYFAIVLFSAFGVIYAVEHLVDLVLEKKTSKKEEKEC